MRATVFLLVFCAVIGAHAWWITHPPRPPKPGRGRGFPTWCDDCGRRVYCKKWNGQLLYDEQHADGSWGRHWCF